ncbi:1255_t:CDS:2, partial [Racocetra fulgida]
MSLDFTNNMSFELNENETTDNMSFELTERDIANNLESYARKMAHEINYPVIENSKNACECKNWLEREAYARRKTTLSKQQILHRCIQNRANYTQRLTFETTENEKISETLKKPVFSTCCAKGKVHLQPVAPTPSILQSLLTENTMRAYNFWQKICMYNSVLAFTLMSAKINNRVTKSSGVYSFRIHREMYHRIGSLLPEDATKPKFCQIYLYDTEEQQLHRQRIMPDLDSSVLAEIQSMLYDVNPYVYIFRQAAQLLCKNSAQELKIEIIKAPIPMRNILDKPQTNDAADLSNSEDYGEEESSKCVMMMQYYVYHLQI